MIDTAETIAADPSVIRLAGRLRDELTERYDVDVTGPTPDPSSPAVVIRVAGETIGCVILVLHDGFAELRSMFVLPAHRGAGLSAILLTAIEDVAARREATTLRLETGTRQPEAMALYVRAAYRPVACVDEPDPETRCFEKHLAPRSDRKGP